MKVFKKSLGGLPMARCDSNPLHILNDTPYIRLLVELLHIMIVLFDTGGGC